MDSTDIVEFGYDSTGNVFIFQTKSERREVALRGRAKRLKGMALARARGTHTKQQWVALLEFCGNKCANCGRRGRIQKDHIRPIWMAETCEQVSDSIENLQPLCWICNANWPTITRQDFRPNGWREQLESIGVLEAKRRSPEFYRITLPAIRAANRAARANQ